MNYFIILGLFVLLFCGIMSINPVLAQIDPLSEIEFFQTGTIHTSENEFQISDLINVRGLLDDKIIRVSGLTLEGFPYITYSKILGDKIDTYGVIFIQGEFKKLNFEQVIFEDKKVEKDENILLLVKYTQRAYSEKTIYVDVKTYDKTQNKLNEFNQNYGYISNAGINLKLTNEEGEEIFSSNGTTNQRGLFETQYLIPENSKRETLILTINAENDSSSTSKIFQIFSLGEIPDHDSN
ncbi:hypothetical protein [Nitrosopumilus sp.]|uniref:hypothetical protein n=1 Tax=Nitrosopumilus sp. TaxID=2024843 RepID=UPI00247D743D|nr:hypothetical protein [Nitrosopumilus sp.]MCV0430043.1 hypothetical protein [Nitrosopumilus sp.]